MVNWRASLLVNNCIKRIQNHPGAPPCRLCADSGSMSPGLCAECYIDLPWNESPCPRCALPQGNGRCSCHGRPLPFSQAQVPLLYEGAIERLIVGFKYYGRLADGLLIGALLGQRLVTPKETYPEAVVPMPTTPSRLRERGFDQVFEIYRGLRASRTAPPVRRCLKRRPARVHQARLSARRRHSSVRGTFRLRQRPPRYVALLDDVVTTGATAEEAAWVLREGGARRVELWAVARTP